MTLDEINKLLKQKHVWRVFEKGDLIRAGQDTIDTFRCRICRLRVKGYINTSAENLNLAGLPTHCGEWLVQEVMES